jgi:hypothetical protein
MTIKIDSQEYQCWHEVGHATICLLLGGDVEFIELMGEDSRGLARARCETTPAIRKSVACGGFAIEYCLFRQGYLEDVAEREMTQIIFRNATIDREMYGGRNVGADDEFTEEEDQAFMAHATGDVAPRFAGYLPRMQRVVRELLLHRKLDGKRVKELLI